MLNELKNITKNVFGENITIVELIKEGKWYEKQYSKCESVEVGKKYGVVIDGINYFDFTSAKNEDNIIKSFITNYINKYETKKRVLIDGVITTRTKEQINHELSKKLKFGIYYPTTYGIGFFCLFHSEANFLECTNKMNEYLTTNKIKYSNEFSEARWVYRYILSNDKTTNTSILSQLN